MKWDMEEEVLLIDLYYFLKEKSRDGTSHFIHELSKALNVRADMLGLEKRSSVFRNDAGISMKLANIEFLATDGKSGLAAYSDLDKEVFKMYHSEPAKFNEINIKTKSKYGISFMDTNKDIENNSVRFRKWMIKNNYSTDTAEHILDEIEEIQQYAKKTRKDIIDIFSIDSTKEINKAINLLMADKFFRIKNKIKNNSYLNSLQIYAKFLKQEIETREPQKNHQQMDTPEDSFSIPETTETSNKQQNYVSAFNYWLINVRKLAQASVRSYVSALNTISEYAIQNGISKQTVFSILAESKMKDFIRILLSMPEFVEKNKIQHNRYSDAMYKYLSFLRSDKDELPLPESILVSDLLDGNPVKKRQKEEIRVLSEIDKQYLEVITEFFPKGFRLNSIIDTKKFRNFFGKRFCNKVCSDDASISKSLSKLCINYDDVRVMSPDSATDKPSLDMLLNYVDEAFADGKPAIYFEALYLQFEDKFINTNIYNAKILKQVLAFHLHDKYHFTRSHMVARAIKKADPAVEIAALLKKQMTSMSFEEIVANIPYISETKVKEFLRQPEFIAVKNSSFSHISNFDVSNDDLEMLKESIQDKLNDTGFIATKKLFSVAEGRLKNFLAKAGITTYSALRDILAYYFSNDFDFVYNFIGERDKVISPSRVLQDFVSNKETFTITEVTNYGKELGISQLIIGAYRDEITSGFLRIDEINYVRKETIIFNAELVDAAIEKFCVDGYVPLSGINRYAIFPSVSVPVFVKIVVARI